MIELRGWSRHGWVPPRPPVPSKPLADRPVMYFYAAADANAPGDQFGLLYAEIWVGTWRLLHSVLVVPDDIAEAEGWGSTQRLPAHSHRRVTTLTDFCDPKATIRATPWAFHAHAYAGRSAVVSYDFIRSLGLMSEYVHRARYGERTRVWLPGVGKPGDKSNILKVAPHQPSLVLRHGRAGTQVEFAYPGKDDAGRMLGQRAPGNEKRYWEGEFIDLASLAYSLDAQRNAEFARHRASFGLSAAGLPPRVTVDAAGANEMVRAVTAIRELAEAIDPVAQSWHINYARTQSPGTLASLQLAGIPAPLEHFDLSDEEYRNWMGAVHGGLCDSYVPGLSRDVIGADLKSAYPLCAHRLGWWSMYTAEHLQREDVTSELRELGRLAAKDPTAVLDPDIWKSYGATLCKVLPQGEPWTVSVTDPRRPDGRTEQVPLTSSVPLYYTWLDYVAAAVLSGQAPELLGATRYTPVNPSGEADPVLELVSRRQKVGKRTREGLLLHAVANSLVWGNPCRFDPLVPQRKGTDPGVFKSNGEKPGPYCFPPVAAVVSAGPRLLLSILKRAVDERGGHVVYRDTDSSFVCGLTQEQVVDALRPCGQLSLPGWAVWKIESAVDIKVVAPKRHIQSRKGSDIKGTRTNLAGQYEAPPGLSDWVAIAHAAYSAGVRWDCDYWAMQLLQVSNLDDLEQLPGTLRAKLGSHYFRMRYGGADQRTALALRPDGPWVDSDPKEQQRPDFELRTPETLGDRVWQWYHPRPEMPITAVTVDAPNDISYRGRVSGVLDDQLAGRPLGSRPRYVGHSCECGCGEFVSGRTDKRFVNDTHRKRAARAQSKG